jgi:hypothetical protein
LYGTAADAVRDLVHVVYQDPKWGAAALAAARAGDTLGFSRALYHGGVMGYYEGFGTTPDVRIERHHHSVQNACILQAHALGEVMPDGSDPPAPPRPMIQIGSTGPLVADVQRWAHVDPDGDFGPITKHAVQLAQLAVHLKPDGRVGPQTWAAIDAAA